MRTQPAHGDSDLKRLFIHNRALHDVRTLAEIERIERAWIVPRVAELEERTPPLASRAQWKEALDGLLEKESAGTPAGHWLAEEATRDQLAYVVAEFAPDGLTEAQNFFPAIPRLPIRSQMAVMRVLIDEFGCGNLQQAHSQLYADLLAELGLPADLDAYLDRTGDETYAFLDVFYWLTQRAPHVEYFLGALAYLEASIPSAFTVQARACERLGVTHGRYYTEHLHIDTFHRTEMQVAIREYEAAHGLDPTRLWVGALLLSDLIGTAFETAVARAREAA
ncbi:iron-containing redox enzyme family protein [Streptomyces sp. UNOC14_S4]|uniref:iron-containing redox enzyme family protein n=1 Tax=Streptomyces sp. UNOC14_S4 TaxID=2872340 RepID=UPI001E2A535C|nr:iron-containing redox enzyme family protein [Streptomyces sp. UNOC14_S4]MCC3770857.1 iron-containing redox enzyme family protein [Streptomyces sp. UNOC14_S4]